MNDLGGSVSGEGGDEGPAQRVVKEIESLGGEAVADSNWSRRLKVAKPSFKPRSMPLAPWTSW